MVPLHITARNSALFYLFDRIHPTLRDITLFHEVLNKTRQRYRLTLGPAIDPDTLPAGSAEAIEVLRARTLELGGQKPQTVLTAPVYGRRRQAGPTDGVNGSARESLLVPGHAMARSGPSLGCTTAQRGLAGLPGPAR